LAVKSKEGPIIIGDVLIDATAKVHPTAKIGPNVAIGANAVIGAGVRVANSIVLDGVKVADHACILFSILGWDCVIGKWARIEGVPSTSNYKGITILGTGVTVAPEVSVRSVIALPHKELAGSYNDEILL
jgi:mannose-1-phosphate guanylyltransferase